MDLQKQFCQLYETYLHHSREVVYHLDVLSKYHLVMDIDAIARNKTLLSLKCAEIQIMTRSLETWSKHPNPVSIDQYSFLIAQLQHTIFILSISLTIR